MLRATAHQLLPTTITGSLPRPSWYTENLGLKSFLQAMVETRFREQYEDALSVYVTEQTIAGLDILTDGDAHFDPDVGGQSWTNYPPRHMGGFDNKPKPTPAGRGGVAFPPGHILHDYLEARVMPGIEGPVTRGDLQYAAMWKVAQRMTPQYRRLIEASPFAALATVGPEGIDCSPRGDQPGFVRVHDDATLMMPDRRGNNRIDSLRNIVRDPRCAFLFLLPGSGTTFRAQGRAHISVDPNLLDSFAVEGKPPRSVIVMAIDELYSSAPAPSCAASCGTRTGISIPPRCPAPARSSPP